MTPIPLTVFVGQHGQEEVAKQLGTSQAAISKAIKTGRCILVRILPNGRLDALELKSFPCGGSQSKTRVDLEHIVGVFSGFEEHLHRSVHPSSTALASP